MNQQDKIYAVWNLSGTFYDEIINSCPPYIVYDEDVDLFDDWFYAQLGL